MKPETPDVAVSAWVERLTSLSLRRRVTVLMLLFSIILVGLVATLNIPLEIFPSGYTGSHIRVWAPWYGAPAREVLDKLVIPLEEELSTVPGLEQMRSRAHLGGCSIDLTFKQRVDMDVAYREVRDRVERARPRLPEDVDRVYLFKEDASGIPVVVTALLIDPSIEDPYDLIDREIVRPIQRIDGVANVRIDGMQQKEILVEVDRKKAEANGLNLYELTQRLRNDNFTMASGYVLEGGRKFLLRSDARYHSLEELRNRMLTPTVRLRDVATIRYAPPERRFAVRVNGRPAVALVVMKESKANTVEVCRRIQATLNALQKNPRLQGIQMESVFNQGKIIVDSLMHLVQNGIMGGLLAGAILFIFLRRFRLTLLVTLSIPLSLLIAFGVIYFSGETLNILTILGLFIGVGMLVDNSIVVSENIYRYAEAGRSPHEASTRGAAEVALAITTATLTTIIVFLPVALIEGEGQFFLLRLALPVCTSLLGSLAVALIFIPLFTYFTIRSKKGNTSTITPPSTWFHKALEWFYTHTLGRLSRLYTSLLAVFLQHRADLVLLILAAIGLTWWGAFRHLQFVQQQEEDQTSFEIIVEPSEEYGFEDLQRYFQQAEKLIESMKQQLHLKAYLVFYRSGWGRIQAWLKPDHPEELTAKIAGEKLYQALPRWPGITLRYGARRGAESPKNQSVYIIRLESDRIEALEQARKMLEPLILRVPGVIGIRGSEEIPPRELGLVLDRDQAEASGVHPQVVAGLVAYALRGASLPKYIQQGREIPVRVRFEPSDRRSLAAILGLRVPTQKGTPMPLGTFVHPIKLQAPRSIERINRRLSHVFVVELDPKQAKQAFFKLMQLQQQADLPEGVTFSRLDVQLVRKELKQMITAGLLSIVFIYLLMGMLFESIVLPLSILFTIPLAAIGMGWIHRLTGLDVDFLGAVGAILLVGVVVNNGIVLIDYVNRLRLAGVPRTEALLTATRLRFRPIMMTALTTIIGMIPLALSRPTDMGLSYRSFGLTLIGGMSTATVLTLLVVPVFYSLFDDMQQRVRQLWHWILGSSHAASRAEKDLSRPATLRP